MQASRYHAVELTIGEVGGGASLWNSAGEYPRTPAGSSLPGFVFGALGLFLVVLAYRSLNGLSGLGLLGDFVLVIVAGSGLILGLAAGIGGVLGRVVADRVSPLVSVALTGVVIGAFLGVLVAASALTGFRIEAIPESLWLAAAGGVAMAATYAFLQARANARTRDSNDGAVRE